MFCDQCGARVGDATVCPACGARLEPVPVAVVVVPAPRAASDVERLMPAVPRMRVWAAGVAGRNLRGTMAGLFAAW